MLGIIICIKQYSKLEGTLNQLQKPALFVSFFVFLQVALERGVGGILRNKTRASSQGKGGESPLIMIILMSEAGQTNNEC